MIHTIINGISTVAINPVMGRFDDPAQSTELSVKINYDNLLDFCNVTWTLYYSITDGDTTIWYQSISNNLTISGDDYTSWNGSNEFPFTFAAAKLGLTITS